MTNTITIINQHQKFWSIIHVILISTEKTMYFPQIHIQFLSHKRKHKYKSVFHLLVHLTFVISFQADFLLGVFKILDFSPPYHQFDQKDFDSCFSSLICMSLFAVNFLIYKGSYIKSALPVGFHPLFRCWYRALAGRNYLKLMSQSYKVL